MAKILDMVDGNIKKIEHEGSIYIRTIGDYIAGDIVYHLTNGKIGVIEALDGDFVYVGFDEGIKKFLYNKDAKSDTDVKGVAFRKASVTKPGSTSIAERVDSLEKRVDALEEKPKEPTFKEGDIVVITANTNRSRNAVGDIGKVGEYITNRDANVNVPGKTAGNGNFTKFEEMRHATQAERQAYEDSLKPALKAGDWVKFAEYDWDIIAGKKYEVKEYPDGDLYIVDDNGDKCFAALNLYSCEITDAPKPLTAFERIGRKEGEFKVGDVVRVINSPHASPNETLIEVISVSHDRVVAKGLSTFGGSVTTYSYGFEHIELIAPAETRVDVA